MHSPKASIIAKCLSAVLMFIVMPAALAAQGYEPDIRGNWIWPEPVFADGVKDVASMEDTYLEIGEIKGDYIYEFQSSKGELLDSGSVSYRDGTITFYSDEGGVREYNFQLGYMGQWEASTTMGAGPVLTVSRDFPDDLIYSMPRELNDQGRYEEALWVAMQDLEHNPESITALFQAAYALGQMGLYRNAGQLYREILAIEPDNKSARDNFEWVTEQLTNQ